ncbi:hypothetical protein ACFY3N_17085 [Streptomyces sp. NPDC000348]|uniref:hypothetical protein n=1 Tax=Streptomyces sp. NPDC000348 TaxID=3364538 RepID=UPI0036CCEA8C
MCVVGAKLATNRRHRDQGHRARSPRLSGALICAGALLLLSCSGQGPDAGSDRPPTSSLKKVGAAVEQAKVLRWKGSWHYDGWLPAGSPGAPASNEVTADLRAMGSGDVFGTLSADGHDVQIMSLAGAALFVKADRVMLQMMGVEEPKAHAGRWIELRGSADTREVLGLKPARLAPSPLASSLVSAAKATGAAKESTPPAPSPAARRFPRPAGVPADAAPVAVVGNANTRSGVYWVTAAAPHRLLGYSGLDVMHDSDGQPHESMFDTVAKLSVRTENAATARGTYTDMRSVIRSLPSVVPISAEPTEEEVSDTVDEECGVLCHTATVTVSLTNRMPHESVTARYTLELTAVMHKDEEGYRIGDPLYRDIGSCTVRLPTAKPGATVQGACTVGGPKLRKAVETAGTVHGFVQMTFQTEATRQVDGITGPSRSKDLLQKLDSRADHVLGTN